MLEIDYGRDKCLSDFAITLLSDFYQTPTETSPQESFARAATAFGTDTAHSQRIYDAASKGWFMFASPVLSNAPDSEGKARGLPISCYLQYMEDTKNGIVDTWAETAHLTYAGGGVGIHARLRGISGKSTGVVSNLHVTDSQMLACKQGDVRRGSAAAYMDVSHPELYEFLAMRKVGGDEHRKNLNIHHGINITDAFMEAVIHDEDWELIDPANKQVTAIHRARDVWHDILGTRIRTGEPYLYFVDTANAGLPVVQRRRGLSSWGSNLCTEITLPTNSERTAVCCLSSVNLEKYEEWKDTTLIADLIEMLDNVIEYFIKNCPDSMKKARFSARMERSIGLGAMGFHAYLQSKRIPFESALAVSHNVRIFKSIKEQADEATRKLAAVRGECPDGVGTGVRNMHLIAIAPNSNNSIILDTSPSVEPYDSNAYSRSTRAGKALQKNKYLKADLAKYGKDTDDIWSDILANSGSVQHLDFLSEQEKDVYKTAREIDQHWIIQHAGDRQPYICQAQSINLFFASGVHRAYLESVHLAAWSRGLKSLYYCRSKNKSSAEKVASQVVRIPLSKEDVECVACSG